MLVTGRVGSVTKRRPRELQKRTKRGREREKGAQGVASMMLARSLARANAISPTPLFSSAVRYRLWLIIVAHM